MFVTYPYVFSYGTFTIVSILFIVLSIRLIMFAVRMFIEIILINEEKLVLSNEELVSTVLSLFAYKVWNKFLTL